MDSTRFLPAPNDEAVAAQWRIPHQDTDKPVSARGGTMTQAVAGASEADTFRKGAGNV